MINANSLARAVNLIRETNTLQDAPWYFAMEYLAGDTLGKLLQEKRNLSVAWRVELIYQIVIILDYLHLREVTHRDLKPDNIMFRSLPTSTQIPSPVLIDFGLAEKQLLNPQVSAASISHAAPERISYLMNLEQGITQRPEQVTTASDIWSLGIIAYEILSYRHPFITSPTDKQASLLGIFKQSTPLDSTQSREVLAQNILNLPPQPLENAIPPYLARLIFDMLDKDPTQRPTTEAVIRRLETEIELISPRL